MKINSIVKEAIAAAVLTVAFASCYRGMAQAAENPYAAITMTEDEGRELEIILALEAQSEPYEGQKGVAEVIFNRVLSDKFPDTVHGVLSQKGQFSTWKYLDHPYNVPNEEQADAILDVLLEGPSVMPDLDYVYFNGGKHKWMHDCFKIKGHWFGK